MPTWKYVNDDSAFAEMNMLDKEEDIDSNNLNLNRKPAFMA